ncbi:MATE family efflux transporter [Aliagarivorans marinus]|uniref:MATE family efflux transporter n=1 Tax=Aliagarivorans marinus TaxID=561965 RepID=UPI000552CC7A|nr:MATE family efflux transporter [Aliagarivorans marinus]
MSHVNKSMTLHSLAWPIFIEWTLTVSMGLLDVIILSLISDNAAAAVGAVNVVLVLAITLLGTTANSGGIVLTQYLGANRRHNAKTLCNTILVINLLIGAGLSLALVLLSPVLPQLIGVDPSLNRDGSVFTAIVGGGMLAQGGVWALSSMLNAHGFTRYTMYNAVFMNLFNVVVSYLLVSQLQCGVGGVAAATVLARILGGMNLYYQLKHRCAIKVSLKVTRQQLSTQAQQIRKIAIPASLEPLSYYGNQLVLTSLIATIGVIALATRTYVISVIAMMEVGAFALSQAAQIQTGHLVGAKNWQRASQQKWRAVQLALIATTLLAAPLLYWREAIMTRFTNDQAMIELGSQLFVIATVVTFIKSYNFVVGACLRASGDVRFAAAVTVSCMWAICVPVSYLMVFHFNYGLLGIWLALGIDECTRALLMGLRWTKGSWRSKSLLSYQN